MLGPTTLIGRIHERHGRESGDMHVEKVSLNTCVIIMVGSN